MVSILTKESFENKEIIETNYKNKWKKKKGITKLKCSIKLSWTS